MDIKEIKSIVDLMKRSSLTEFQLEEKDFKIRICRKNEEIQTVYQSPTPPPFPITAIPAQSPQTAPAPAPAMAVDESKLIKSPMVGTFFAAPSPGTPAFVGIGDKVTDTTVVCILEAMKVMNEITADAAGTIAEILIEDGESVEYGQPLFRLK